MGVSFLGAVWHVGFDLFRRNHHLVVPCNNQWDHRPLARDSGNFICLSQKMFSQDEIDTSSYSCLSCPVMVSVSCLFWSQTTFFPRRCCPCCIKHGSMHLPKMKIMSHKGYDMRRYFDKMCEVYLIRRIPLLGPSAVWLVCKRDIHRHTWCNYM